MGLALSLFGGGGAIILIPYMKIGMSLPVDQAALLSLITIGLSNFMSKATADPVAQNANSNIVGVVLDPTVGTGRMKSRLLAVQANGKILVLDTKLAQTQWVPFQFSP